MEPIISIAFVFVSGFIPVAYTVVEHKRFEANYSCPKCGSLVFPRLGTDNREYWVCAVDSCVMHDKRMLFLNGKYYGLLES